MKLISMAAIVAVLAGCATPAPKKSEEHAMKAPEAKTCPEAKACPEAQAKPAMGMKKKAPAPAQLALACKVSLAQAIETALAKVYGQALTAEVELENGKPHICVKIFSKGKIWEVEINGTTGAITEVEQEDDDDDDDGDDDDGDGD